MNKTKLYYFVLLVVSGLVIGFSWPPGAFALPVFIFLIPMLFVLFDENQFSKRQKILYAFVPLVIWNSIVSFWIYKVNLVNGLLVNFINPLYQLLPLLIFIFFYRKIQRQSMQYLFFISLWIFFEYLHQHWELAYPMLALGNCLATYHKYIQWYEYTGALGGTLWILIVNILLYKLIKNSIAGVKVTRSFVISSFLLVGVPICISLFIYHSEEIEDGKQIEVEAIHPNLDCYKEKYLLGPDSLIKKYMKLTFSNINQETRFVIWPETAITDLGEIHWLTANPLLVPIKDSLKKYPNLTIISGAIVYELYKGKNKSVPHIRYSEDEDVWYYTYNAAIQLNKNSSFIQFKTKRNLVPFEETLPYPDFFDMFPRIKSLGNFSFSFKRSTDKIFDSDGIKSGTRICYESAFGKATASMSAKGAQVLFVILNEGWYNDENAANQFLYLSVLRSIETKKYVVRSSNRGVSAIINQRGDILEKQDAKTESIVKGTVALNTRVTFYSQHGDYIGIAAGLLILCIVISTIFFQSVL